MALRVLLADESSTIKKVIQLALQDYGVEVKNINVGVDALEVARSFRPDIVFADILLQKKSGYDVCQEMKKDEVLRKTPVILMWSGFLELDEDQFKSSHADDQLEKPFNVESLRNLIKKWVPKVETQSLSDFLTYPSSVQDLTVQAEAATEPIVIKELPPTPADLKPEWTMDNFDDIQEFVKEEESAKERHLEVVKPHDAEFEFQEVSALSQFSHINSLSEFGEAEDETPEPIPQMPAEAETDENWMTQDLSKFKLDIPDTEDDDVLIPVPSLEEIVTPQPKLEPVTQAAPPTPPPQLSAEELERILRVQSKDIIESVVWKIVPEMASSIIREELNRLLREEEIR